MARYALYVVSTGYIMNLFELAEPQNFIPSDPSFAIVSATSSVAAVGGAWDGTQFIPPETPPSTNDPATDVALLFRLNDHMAPKVPAVGSVTPSAVAAAGAAGTSALAARADHVHAGVQVSSATPAALGSAAAGTSADAARADHVHQLPTIPGPSGSTPLVASGAGAVGVGTTYARSDHVHPAQAVPAASSSTPAAIAASGAVGVSTDYARSDHTHAQNLLPSNTNPLVDGTVAQGTSDRYSRQDHVHPLPGMAATTVTNRVLGTAWQPSATRAVLVSATIRISVTSTIAGASEAAVELRSDSSNPPTTVRTRAQNRNAVSLAVALQIVDEKTFTLVHLVPAGDRVVLTQSVNTGTNSCTIERVTETVIG